MAVVAVGHAADDGVFVGLFGQQRHQFADSDSIHIGGNRLVQRTAIIVPRLRFRIKGVQVRRAAPHPDLDDRLGFGLRRGGVRQRAQAQVMAQQQARPRRAGRAAPPRAGRWLSRAGAKSTVRIRLEWVAIRNGLHVHTLPYLRCQCR